MSSRGLLIFCVCCVIFHLANAAMLPLVGQKLALQDEDEGTALMSGCIVAAQVVMVPMAALVGHKADIWGRKPLFLAGLAYRTIAFGCSRCKVSTAWERGFMARFFLSLSRI